MKKLLFVIQILVTSITSAQSTAIDSTKSETSQLPDVNVTQDKFNEGQNEAGAGVVVGGSIAATGLFLIASASSRPKVITRGPFGYSTFRTRSFDAIGQVFLGILLTPIGVVIAMISSPNAKQRREQRRLRRYQEQRVRHQL
jgi:hypothetical protein